jgi:hypothetical protein
MLVLASIAAYFGILWVLGVLVIWERRRARSADRSGTQALPYSMSRYDRP